MLTQADGKLTRPAKAEKSDLIYHTSIHSEAHVLCLYNMPILHSIQQVSVCVPTTGLP